MLKLNKIQEMIYNSMDKNKNNIAIEYGENSLTYLELDNKSNKVANMLIQKGIKPETFIGIMIEDKIDFIISLVGIIKGGCVFVPLDTSYPEERLKLMIDTCDIAFLITDDIKNNIVMNQTKTNNQCIILQDIFFNENEEWNNKPNINYHADDQIYVYFTSGTTGNPKAIVGKNDSLAHFIQWELSTFKINAKVRVSQFTNVGFDVFLRDLFVPLCAGGTLCIPPNEDILYNGKLLVNWIMDNQIQLIHCVPSLFRLIKNNCFEYLSSCLKYILLAGEKINPKDIRDWYNKFDENIQLINLYGPTETTLAKTMYLISKSDVDKERIPIGKPIDGCRIVILDKNMQPCPQGTIGEIYIRTPYRTHGYYKNPNLNKEKFIVNPFNKDSEDLIYKSGDLGTILPDGNIEFLGRIDRQVKIRGNRVELEEIENILINHPITKEIVVINKEISIETNVLIAFVVLDDNNEEVEVVSLENNLKEYSLNRMPSYMVPNHFAILDSIPKKQNGKVDYEVLSNKYFIEENEYIPPRTNTEEVVHNIWKDILEINKIGVNDSFFKMGGSSLNIMRLIVEIQNEFDISITLSDLINNSTIKQQAELIDSLIVNQENGDNLEDNWLNKALSVSKEQGFICFNNKTNNNIFVFPPIMGYGIVYNTLATFINSHSIFTFDFFEDNDRVDKYIEIITSVQKHGPYIFLGYSAGGNLAFEIANEMKNRGLEVTDIILIDSKYREVEKEIIFDEEIERDIKDIIDLIKNNEAYSENINIASIEEEIKKKVQASFKYHSKLKTNHKLDSNIYLIKSKDEYSYAKDWMNSTSGNFELYDGQGTHQEMLKITENYSIICNILNKLNK